MVTTKLDTSRAEELFGFRAKVGFEEGLRRAIEWYTEQVRTANDQAKCG